MDACAMIARCHRHQYPHEYGRGAVMVAWYDRLAAQYDFAAAQLWRPDESLAPKRPNHDHGGEAC